MITPKQYSRKNTSKKMGGQMAAHELMKYID